MYSAFVPVPNPSQFALKVGLALGKRLVHLKSADVPDYAPEIVFSETVTESLSNKWRRSPRPGSLQRRLLNCAVGDLSKLLNKEARLMDIAGGKAYGLYMGLKAEHIDAVNVLSGPEVTHVGNAENVCESIPECFYDAVLSLNYLFMARHPERVMENVARFLKPGGIAMLDFVSLSYWYLGRDGRHWQTYSPGQIFALLQPHFSDIVLVPVGNWLQAMFNYYYKRVDSDIGRWICMFMGTHLGWVDRDPYAAIHYLAVVRKAE